VRLRRAACAGPGITRRRVGKGFAYYWPDGSRVTDPGVLERVSGLVLPPAWRDVWICPWPNGHIQATGTDAAGRRQYRYHDEWRRQRDEVKHERVLDFAKRLPAARARVRKHLGEDGLTRQRVLATAFRLLDLGFFRVGGESYAEDNGTYGLATMRKEHVRIEGDVVVFDYIAKGAKQRVQSVVDDSVRDVVAALKRRRGGGPELLAYRSAPGWSDVRSDDINGYLREVTGGSFTAKDFRTWHATVLTAVGLAVSTGARTSHTAHKRAVNRVIGEVAHYLGNTPAVCRASYIDPRVIDLYDDGVTIARALDRLAADADYGQPATHGAIEAAVLRMLGRAPSAKSRRPPPPRRQPVKRAASAA
jgi:DNA topoisomerase I